MRDPSVLRIRRRRRGEWRGRVGRGRLGVWGEGVVGEFRFSGREAEVLEEAEILVGNVDITVR